MRNNDSVITMTERDRLGRLENTIARGLETFVEVGLALQEIRDSRLYRAGYATFDGYCRDRWGFTPQRAYQLIEAANIARGVQEVNPGLQTTRNLTERSARELRRLPAEQQPEALAAAMEKHGPAPTAAEVRSVVAERIAPDLASVQPAEKARRCPHCGGAEFDGDGDCLHCFEPAEPVKPVRKPPADGLARRVRQTVKAWQSEHPETTNVSAALILRAVADQLTQNPEE